MNCRIKIVFLRALFPALSVIFLSGEISECYAERFKVFYAYDEIENSAKLEERKDLEMDISNVSDEREKIYLISQKVMRDELESESTQGHSKIDFALNKISRKGSVWYVNYLWCYVSELTGQKRLPMRSFREKIDLDKKFIIHDRTKDVQYTVSTNSI